MNLSSREPDDSEALGLARLPSPRARLGRDRCQPRCDLESAGGLRNQVLVDLELEVDESLLGGAVIRAEDMVIDDSVRTRLERLSNSLID